MIGCHTSYDNLSMIQLTKKVIMRVELDDMVCRVFFAEAEEASPKAGRWTGVAVPSARRIFLARRFH